MVRHGGTFCRCALLRLKNRARQGALDHFDALRDAVRLLYAKAGRVLVSAVGNVEQLAGEVVFGRVKVLIRGFEFDHCPFLHHRDVDLMSSLLPPDHD